MRPKQGTPIDQAVAYKAYDQHGLVTLQQLCELAVELDGRVHLSEEVWERDHVRHARLTNAGWHVLAFTWRQYRREPAFIVREVKTALTRRGSLAQPS